MKDTDVLKTMQCLYEYKEYSKALRDYTKGTEFEEDISLIDNQLHDIVIRLVAGLGIDKAEKVDGIRLFEEHANYFRELRLNISIIALQLEEISLGISDQLTVQDDVFKKYLDKLIFNDVEDQKAHIKAITGILRDNCGVVEAKIISDKYKGNFAFTFIEKIAKKASNAQAIGAAAILIFG